jgi:hypothetical protein
MHRLYLPPLPVIALLLVNTPGCATQPPLPPLAPRPPAGMRVTLQDSGAEPRELLRYQIPSGASENAVMAVAMRIDMGLPDGSSRHTKLPTQNVLITASAEKVAEAADWTVISEVRGNDVVAGPGDDPTLVALVQRLSGSMVGIQIKGEMSERGFVKNTRAAIPSSLAPELQGMLSQFRGTMEQAAFALPAEPVGRGARWQIDNDVDDAGIVTHRRTQVTLVGRTERRLILDVKVEQSAEPQEVKVVGLTLKGATSYVESLHATGHGRATMELSSLISTGRSTTQSTATMLIVTPNPRTKERQTVRLTMKTEVELSMAPAR